MPDLPEGHAAARYVGEVNYHRLVVLVMSGRVSDKGNQALWGRRGKYSTAPGIRRQEDYPSVLHGSGHADGDSDGNLSDEINIGAAAL